MAKNKKDKKEKLTSDGIYNLDFDSIADDWAFAQDLNVGSVSQSATTYDISDFGKWHTDDMLELQLREKYPALNDAWKHYVAVKKMCMIREQEDDK
jgi:hypothetical protein